MENSEKLKKAIAFATQAHNGQYRKGSDVEYITHPMEVLDILTSMNADENLLIAGVLHDTVEDTEVTMEDIAEQFGDDVAALIGGHTEDKSKSWDERKSAMIDAVDDGDRRLKMLVMSDLLSNMRSTWSDYQKIGDVVWEKFNAPRHRQSWYYSSMLDALCDMQWNEAAESVYWEATGIYKDIYVLYGLNQEENCLYQISAHGENAILHKGSPQWLNCPKTISEKMTVVSVNSPKIWKINGINHFGSSMIKIWSMEIIPCFLRSTACLPLKCGSINLHLTEMTLVPNVRK